VTASNKKEVVVTTAVQPLPAVHTYEDDDELVVEIDLPENDRRDFELTVEHGALKVTVPRPRREPVDEDVWRIHADATPC
jgi:HSP20 family molecular chaperone IbpA